ncbi:MAG TPA: hypothetical protein VMU13_03535 [Candidatus Paceibacterota bacterium]|nr:hypothetical protein [Candidatus Paceibacterota bacterium]
MEADNNPRQKWLMVRRLKEDSILAGSAEWARHEIARHNIAGYPSVDRQIAILEELQKQGAIEVRQGFGPSGNLMVIYVDDFYLRPDNTYGKGVSFKVLARFHDLYKEYAKYESGATSTAPVQCWITREGGEFLFNGKPVHIKNPDAKSVQIFSATYFLKPTGGTVSYRDIKKKCGADKKSVQRALTGEYAAFFRSVPDIKRTPSDRPLFEADNTGERLIFNNERR